MHSCELREGEGIREMESSARTLLADQSEKERRHGERERDGEREERSSGRVGGSTRTDVRVYTHMGGGDGERSSVAELQMIQYTPGPLAAGNWKPFSWYGERNTSGSARGPCVANAPT